MGHGIAQVLATKPGTVMLHDPSPDAQDVAMTRIRESLDSLVMYGLVDQIQASAAVNRIRFTHDLEEAVNSAWFVIEASPEDLRLKRDLFAHLEALTSSKTILASNTSGLSLAEMTGHLEHQERVVGSHFFLPAQIIPLVEVSRGPETSDETMDSAVELWSSRGKRPIRIEKDVPGYVANRLQSALVREATHLLAEGVASAEDIDMAVQMSFGLRYTVSGPLEQRDLGGLDLNVALSREMWPHLNTSPGPLPLVVEKVRRGELGLKSGKGFFDWRNQDPEIVRRERTARLIEVMSKLGIWPDPTTAHDTTSGGDRW
jgi:3-hydroxybutyryl-CoA dehydrogenase